MHNTLADTLQVTARGTPTELISVAAWERISRLGRQLPAVMVEAAYFECRLGPAGGAVDHIVRLDETGWDVVAGRNPKLRLPDSLASSPVWGRIACLCRALADDELLRRALRHLWLEFDLNAAPEGAPSTNAVGDDPSLFVALERNWAGRAAARDWRLLTGLLLEHLIPHLVGGATHEAVCAVVGQRPNGADTPYLGFMLSRAVPCVRVYLAGVASRDTPAMLERMGWPGDPGELCDLLGTLHVRGRGAGPDPAVGLVHLDLARGVLPRIGVEYPLRRAPQLRGALVETGFLDRLVAMRLCSRGARRGLAVWPGRQVCVLPHHCWPSLITRRVNHIKIVHEPGRAPQAKGYLLSRWTAVPPRTSGRPP